MSEITKKSLNERLLMVETLLGLHRKLPEQISVDQANNAIFRMQCALSNGREIAEREPQLKVLDQSVFDGQDEKWRFAAVDKDGRAYAFTRKPEIDQDDPCFIDGDASKCKWIGDDYDATNWKNSLIERETELTGSDLCRAMLARRDRFVFCLASNSTQDMTLRNSPELEFVLINGYCEDRGFSVAHSLKYFKYVKPVKLSDATKLTAKEAGL